MNTRRKLSAAVVAGCLSVAGLAVAAPAQADSSVGTCYRVVAWSGDMCLFYHSGYWGSDTGFWRSNTSGGNTWSFSPGGSSANFDHFNSAGDGQGQGLWHNMGSDENYNTYFTALIGGANGATTTVYPDTSNNLGGNDYNIDEYVDLYG